MQVKISDKISVLINDVPSAGWINISCTSGVPETTKFMGMLYAFYDGRVSISAPKHYGSMDNYNHAIKLIDMCVAIANRDKENAKKHAKRVDASTKAILQCMEHIEEILVSK